MSRSRGADLGDLRQLEANLRRWHGDIAAEAGRVAAAIHVFRSRSTEVVPSVPPHLTRGEDLAAELRALARRVGATADDLRAADRWAGVRHMLARTRDIHGNLGTVADTSRVTRDGWLAHRQAALDRTVGARWTTRQVGTTLGVGDRAARQRRDVWNEALRQQRTAIAAGRDAHQRWLASNGLRAEVAATRGDLRRIAGRGAAVAPMPSSATRTARLIAAYGNSRIAAVARVGGRALVVAGLVDGVVQTAAGVAEGDGGRVALGVASTAASAAMLSGFPPAQIAGAVVSAGILIYQHRDAIGRWGSSMGAAASRFVQGLF